jgi:hypothetical protein
MFHFHLIMSYLTCFMSESNSRGFVRTEEPVSLHEDLGPTWDTEQPSKPSFLDHT